MQWQNIKKFWENCAPSHSCRGTSPLIEHHTTTALRASFAPPWCRCLWAQVVLKCEFLQHWLLLNTIPFLTEWPIVCCISLSLSLSLLKCKMDKMPGFVNMSELLALPHKHMTNRNQYISTRSEPLWGIQNCRGKKSLSQSPSQAPLIPNWNQVPTQCS